MHRLYAAEKALKSEVEDLRSYCILGRGLKYSDGDNWAFHAIFESGKRICFARFLLQFGFLRLRYWIRNMESAESLGAADSDFLARIGLHPEFERLSKVRNGFWCLHRGETSHLLINHGAFRRKWKMGLSDFASDTTEVVGKFMGDLERRVNDALKDKGVIDNGVQQDPNG